MPWFPIPFILPTKDGETKTNKYTYSVAEWSEPTLPPSVVDITMGNSSSYWYYNGDMNDYDDDYPDGTHPTQIQIPKTTVNGITGGVINLLTIPANHTKNFSMLYRLKFKLNPKSKNKIVNFRFCYRTVATIEITDFWGGWWDEQDPTPSWVCLDYADYRCYCSCVIENGKNAEIKVDGTDGFVPHEMQYTHSLDITPWSDYYHANIDATVYRTVSVDLSQEDSYAYLVLQLKTFTPTTKGHDVITQIYEDGRRADASLFHAMELDNLNDIIFGEGFSTIYVGENNIGSGMINNGENSPSAIYVGENLVWSK